ncbi:unnamed protein product [Urochloa decumbens]|uniref:Uncharacterized protein n=1 Tax=Urochloa decumbens TaxID=240449 RepID=A0ABC9A266_9POAL
MEAASAAGESKPAEAKKTKMVRVKQEYIDRLISSRPLKRPFPFLTEERILLLDPKEQEETRAIQARIAASIKVALDEEEDILEQYHAKGYAEVEAEDEDDEEGVDMGN